MKAILPTVSGAILIRIGDAEPHHVGTFELPIVIESGGPDGTVVVGRFDTSALDVSEVVEYLDRMRIGGMSINGKDVEL